MGKTSSLRKELDKYINLKDLDQSVKKESVQSVLHKEDDETLKVKYWPNHDVLSLMLEMLLIVIQLL